MTNKAASILVNSQMVVESRISVAERLNTMTKPASNELTNARNIETVFMTTPPLEFSKVYRLDSIKACKSALNFYKVIL